MKTIFKKSALAIVLTAGLLASCINDDDYKTPALDCTETSLVKNMEPNEVPATEVATQYFGPGIIEAYVVSSDIGGNFFKTISLQTLDGSFGFSIPADVTTVFKKFEPGRKVLIQLDSTYTDIDFGSMRIGALFNNEVGRLSVTDFERVVHRSCEKRSEEELVQKIPISDALSDNRINTLIELQNVQFSDAAKGKTYFDVDNQLGGATNHYLIDAAGNEIIFRTSSFASYAGFPVDTLSGSVRGILTKFNSDYQFIARSEEDIKLTKPRF